MQHETWKGMCHFEGVEFHCRTVFGEKILSQFSAQPRRNQSKKTQRPQTVPYYYSTIAPTQSHKCKFETANGVVGSPFPKFRYKFQEKLLVFTSPNTLFANTNGLCPYRRCTWLGTTTFESMLFFVLKDQILPYVKGRINIWHISPWPVMLRDHCEAVK